jgi:DNA polymerase-3 subunit gamma/tau
VCTVLERRSDLSEDAASVARVAAPLALYRRYRPETFAEMVGQDHVTGPLSTALRNDRVNHAYLFSGPRGCGKTTSARILARCLVCEKGPTPEPCGVCQPCRDLARGGPGHIDVIEIDAASHGGVDDARDLRERAFFSPVQARYKIYIVDEAHMVSSQGFNALLKLVEEPPEHVKFIFATTEPDKVIGTIRSRTHHYPFRLVPPKTMGDYLAMLCVQEGVDVEPTVLPLVVRAGGGAFRDSLSVLDQLMGSSADGRLTYDAAVALLGYTPESLLDEAVDAIAAHDGAGVFGVIDKVIESGQDPRRFAEDLLRRLRDLVIVQAVPDAVSRGLIEAPPELADRLTSQASRLGSAEATRAAEVVNTGLTAMRGATAPRLLLELICARLLLPAVDDDMLGVTARLDRVERRLAGEGVAVAPAAPAAAAPAAAVPVSAPVVSPPPSRPAPAPEPVTPQVEAPPPSATKPTSAPVEADVEWPTSPTPLAAAKPEAAATAATAAPAPAPTGSDPNLVEIRRMWPELLEEVKNNKRMAWMILSQNAQVLDVSKGILTLGVPNNGVRTGFVNSGSDDLLRQAIKTVLHIDLRIETIVDPSASGTSSRGNGAAPVAPTTTPVEQRAGGFDDLTPPPPAPFDDQRTEVEAPAPPPVSRSSAPPRADAPPSAPPAPPSPVRNPADTADGRAKVNQAREQARSGSRPSRVDRDAAVDVDRDVSTDDGASQTELLAREFGAKLIEEYDGDRKRG